MNVRLVEFACASFAKAHTDLVDFTQYRYIVRALEPMQTRNYILCPPLFLSLSLSHFLTLSVSQTYTLLTYIHGPTINFHMHKPCLQNTFGHKHAMGFCFFFLNFQLNIPFQPSEEKKESSQKTKIA